MGAGRHDFLDVVAVEHLDVGKRLHLEQELVAGPLGGVAGAALLGAQHGVLDFQVLQDPDKIAGHALVAVVKGPGAADPEQNFGLFALGGVVGHGGDFDLSHVFDEWISG